jgi:putative transposase
VALREKHPSWGLKKILDVLGRRDSEREYCLPSRRRRASWTGRRYRRAHPGCPKSVPAGLNDIWAADEFRLKNGKYCFPLTVSDLSSRYILGVDAHPAISLERSFAHLRRLFEEFGLPKRIRTDNGVPFASNALARLSQLSV